jgi:putative transposase-like DNA-binding protein
LAATTKRADDLLVREEAARVWRLLRLDRRVANIAQEAHWQVAATVLRRATVVVAPVLGVTSILKSDDMGPLAKRVLSAQSVAEFSAVLDQKSASRWPHCAVLSKGDVTEAHVADPPPGSDRRRRKDRAAHDRSAPDRRRRRRRGVRVSFFLDVVFPSQLSLTWIDAGAAYYRFSSCTCSGCGAHHSTLGSSKVFDCATCGFLGDRDSNACRNIALRNAPLVCSMLEKLGYDTRQSSWSSTVPSSTSSTPTPPPPPAAGAKTARTAPARGVTADRLRAAPAGPGPPSTAPARRSSSSSSSSSPWLAVGGRRPRSLAGSAAVAAESRCWRCECAAQASHAG